MELKKKSNASSQNVIRDLIRIIGAREHNLKNISVDIPKNALTVITGPSGSGKSSLAMDILYAEGKRRYMESLSSYARQFLGIVKKPDFDRIDGLCPAIAIEQKTVGHNPRSTVGTITELWDYMRVLYARIGKPFCPQCSLAIQPESPENIAALIEHNFVDSMIMIAAPVVIHKKGEFVQLLLELFNQGFYRFIIDGKQLRFSSQEEIKALKLGKTYHHSIDVLLDQITIEKSQRVRLQENVERSFSLSKGFCKIIVGDKQYLYSSSRMCTQCSLSFPEIEPRLFSFNSPIGACAQCHGLGCLYDEWNNDYYDWHKKKSTTCFECHGKRLNSFALSVKLNDKNIYELADFSIKNLIEFFKKLNLLDHERAIAHGLLKEITNRLQFLHNVGLSYLSLNRTAETLSGGEGQRIRLATQIGSALSGVLYILDEPSIGLHQRDNDRLIDTLKNLRDQGNTVVVVEHDLDTIAQADYLIDMGPGAGILGGHITAYGSPAQLAKNKNSLTGAYLSGKKCIALPQTTRKPKGFITLKHVRKHNLKDLTVTFPLGVLCCVSGISGSGKSTLVLDELAPTLYRNNKKQNNNSIPDIDAQGLENIENVIVIDQSPIGRTPRSNPATYVGIFDDIRTLFAQLPESNARGYKIGRFSFNVDQGRCYECRGEGIITVSMQFLADVIMVCKSCKGKRYNAETLAIKYKEKSIADILELSVLEALEFFSAHKNIVKRLQLLADVGLDYLKLGQPSTTLSGGEAQRIKLVNELAKRGSRTMYILDEPTTGLHVHDIEKLLNVLNRLIDKGNSVVVIEHNIDVLKTADHIIDMGPEGGSDGGMIVAQGTPQEIAKNNQSHTGRYLKNCFKKS